MRGPIDDARKSAARPTGGGRSDGAAAALAAVAGFDLVRLGPRLARLDDRGERLALTCVTAVSDLARIFLITVCVLALIL